MNSDHELWLCRVELKFTTHMVLKFDGKEWWQYTTPNLLPNIEGWIGVNFNFEPIQKIEQ